MALVTPSVAEAFFDALALTDPERAAVIRRSLFAARRTGTSSSSSSRDPTALQPLSELRDRRGLTLLARACLHGCGAASLRALVEDGGCSLSSREPDGLGLLHTLVKHGRPGALRALLALAPYDQRIDGDQPIDEEYGRRGAPRCLRCWEDVEARSRDCALFYALKRLRAGGAEGDGTSSSSSSSSSSPPSSTFAVAQRRVVECVVVLMRAKGAERALQHRHPKTGSGALHCAVTCATPGAAIRLLLSELRFDLLSRTGSPGSSQRGGDHRGRLRFHSDPGGGDGRGGGGGVEFMGGAKARVKRAVDMADGYGHTPLWIAASKGCVEAVLALLQAGASVDCTASQPGSSSGRRRGGGGGGGAVARGIQNKACTAASWAAAGVSTPLRAAARALQCCGSFNGSNGSGGGSAKRDAEGASVRARFGQVVALLLAHGASAGAAGLSEADAAALAHAALALTTDPRTRTGVGQGAQALPSEVLDALSGTGGHAKAGGGGGGGGGGPGGGGAGRNGGNGGNGGLLNCPGAADGRTALHAAAHGGCAGAVARLWARGADADARDAEGFTPLELAVYRDDYRKEEAEKGAGAAGAAPTGSMLEAAAVVLVEGGCDLGTVAQARRLVWQCAAVGRWRLLAALQRHPRPDQPTRGARGRDVVSSACWHGCPALWVASQRGHLDAAHVLLHGPRPSRARPSGGGGLSGSAVVRDSDPNRRFELSATTPVVARHTPGAWTEAALPAAGEKRRVVTVRHGTTKAVQLPVAELGKEPPAGTKYWVREVARVRPAGVAPPDGTAPLHQAAMQGHLGVLRLLLAHPATDPSLPARLDPRIPSGGGGRGGGRGQGRGPLDGRTALHLAALAGHADCVEALLRHNHTIKDDDDDDDDKEEEEEEEENGEDDWRRGNSTRKKGCVPAAVEEDEADGSAGGSGGAQRRRQRGRLRFVDARDADGLTPLLLVLLEAPAPPCAPPCAPPAHAAHLRASRRARGEWSGGSGGSGGVKGAFEACAALLVAHGADTEAQDWMGRTARQLAHAKGWGTRGWGTRGWGTRGGLAEGRGKGGLSARARPQRQSPPPPQPGPPAAASSASAARGSSGSSSGEEGGHRAGGAAWAAQRVKPPSPPCSGPRGRGAGAVSIPVSARKNAAAYAAWMRQKRAGGL